MPEGGDRQGRELTAGRRREGRWRRRALGMICLLALLGAAATLGRYFALLIIGLEVLAGMLLATDAWAVRSRTLALLAVARFAIGGEWIVRAAVALVVVVAAVAVLQGANETAQEPAASPTAPQLALGEATPTVARTVGSSAPAVTSTPRAAATTSTPPTSAVPETATTLVSPTPLPGVAATRSLPTPTPVGKLVAGIPYPPASWHAALAPATAVARKTATPAATRGPVLVAVADTPQGSAAASPAAAASIAPSLGLAPPAQAPARPTATAVPPVTTPEPVPPTPTGSPTPTPAHAGVLVVAEIDARCEVVTIANRGNAPQSMAGWKLQSGPLGRPQQQVYEFPSWFVLGAGASVRVHSFAGADSATDLYWGHSSPNGGRHYWGNHGDVGVLYDAQGAEVSRLVY